jgi:hypothetical protein
MQGYQFLARTQKSYWLHWDTPVAISPDAFTLHDTDLMDVQGWLYATAKWPQVHT